MTRATRTSRNTFGDFVCMFCHNFVSAEAALSGVQNRNHCPICLTSRHLDLFEAGDRLSACKGTMRPIGLTFKITIKRYKGRAQGELMLVHLCEDCSRISINRMAADDNAAAALDILADSHSLSTSIKSAIHESGVNILESGQHFAVHEQLLGRE